MGGNWLVTARGWQLVVDNWLMTICWRQLVGGSWLAREAGGGGEGRRSGYHTKNKKHTSMWGMKILLSTMLRGCGGETSRELLEFLQFALANS